MSGGYAMIYMSFLSYLRSLNLMSNAYTYDGIDGVSTGVISRGLVTCCGCMEKIWQTLNYETPAERFSQCVATID